MNEGILLDLDTWRVPGQIRISVLPVLNNVFHHDNYSTVAVSSDVHGLSEAAYVNHKLAVLPPRCTAPQLFLQDVWDDVVLLAALLCRLPPPPRL